MTEENVHYPNHIAIVMDGNGRWAQSKNRPRVFGHQQGVECTRNIIETCVEKGIAALTLFAFSSENWKRPKQEVSFLMQLFIKSLSIEAEKLHQNNVRLKVIGDVNAFDEKLKATIQQVETLTQSNSGLKLFIAANYGGHWDILQATKNIVQKVVDKKLRVDDIQSDVFCQELCLSDAPEVDLFIRTGGEVRISNFLLWQIAYAELYFTETLWPDFNRQEFLKSISKFSTRERRFGQISEQIKAHNSDDNNLQDPQC